MARCIAGDGVSRLSLGASVGASAVRRRNTDRLRPQQCSLGNCSSFSKRLKPSSLKRSNSST